VVGMGLVAGGAAVVASNIPAAKPPATVASQPLPSALEGHTGEVLAATLSPDGKTLATGGGGAGEIKLWDWVARQEKVTLRSHVGWVTGLAFSPDEKTLASSSWDFRVKIWDVATGTVKQTFVAHEGGVDGLVYTPDGQTLITYGGDHNKKSEPGEIKLWD